MSEILYVDDEVNNLTTFQITLEKWYRVDVAEDAMQALEMLNHNSYKVLVTDQRMPRMTGLELASKVKDRYKDVIIIILTAFDDHQAILQAINQGGIFRYLMKPWDLNDLKQTLHTALEAYEMRLKNLNLTQDLLKKNKALNQALKRIEQLNEQLKEENIQLKEQIGSPEGLDHIVGNSQALLETIQQLQLVSKSASSVLLTGETGTGKELFVSAIHRLSARKDKMMVSINCAAIPESLMESELFGHEKGAFTGADQRKYGKLELADGGTLFMDEIGELPLDVQAKLLRVLQDWEVTRLGSSQSKKVDVRLVTATNRELEKEVQEGKFRSDLYYRLNVVPIHIPPLRERKEDIPLLVNYFIEKLNHKTGKIIQSISSSHLQKLMDYDWPGNIRELENIVERAHVLSLGSKLEIGSWFKESRSKQPTSNEILSLQENERQHILKVLKMTRWKVRGEGGAAQLLNIHPSTLQSRMKKLGIERPA